jgi:hypothetical protein
MSDNLTGAWVRHSRYGLVGWVVEDTGESEVLVREPDFGRFRWSRWEIAPAEPERPEHLAQYLVWKVSQ